MVRTLTRYVNGVHTRVLVNGVFAVAGMKRRRGKYERRGGGFDTRASHVAMQYQGRRAVFFDAKRFRRLKPSVNETSKLTEPLVLKIPKWADTIIIALGDD